MLKLHGLIISEHFRECEQRQSWPATGTKLAVVIAKNVFKQLGRAESVDVFAIGAMWGGGGPLP